MLWTKPNAVTGDFLVTVLLRCPENRPHAEVNVVVVRRLRDLGRHCHFFVASVPNASSVIAIALIGKVMSATA